MRGATNEPDDVAGDHNASADERRVLALGEEVALFIAVAGLAISIGGLLPVAWYLRLIVAVALGVGGLLLVGRHATRISRLVARTVGTSTTAQETPGGMSRSRRRRASVIEGWAGLTLDPLLYAAGSVAFAGAAYIVATAVR